MPIINPFRVQEPGYSMPTTTQSQHPKLLDEVRQILRLQHYSIHTERSYVEWIVRFVRFHGVRSREDLFPTEPKIEAFLTDLTQGYGAVYLPHALARKYPHTASEWGWQYVFPARNLARDPRSGITRRHHVDPSVINKAIKVAVRRAGLTKHISAHTLRNAST